MLLSKFFFSGSLYKPQAVKALKDFLQVPDTVNEPQRVSTLCKLLHYRSTGSSTTDSNDHSFSFELFVTDASLQYVTKSVGSFDGFLPYLKITGKSSQVLPSELKAVPTSCGMNLSAKHLLFISRDKSSRRRFFNVCVVMIEEITICSSFMQNFRL